MLSPLALSPVHGSPVPGNRSKSATRLFNHDDMAVDVSLTTPSSPRGTQNDPPGTACLSPLGKYRTGSQSIHLNFEAVVVHCIYRVGIKILWESSEDPLRDLAVSKKGLYVHVAVRPPLNPLPPSDAVRKLN